MKIATQLSFRFIAFPAAFITTLLCACSTISMRQTLSYPLPPARATDVVGRNAVAVDAALEQQYRADPTNNPLRLLVRYQQAKLWLPSEPAKSCALWMEVSAEKRFPLAPLARLRSMEACPSGKGAYTSFDELMASTPEPWLAETLLRSGLRRAERTDDKVWEMRLAMRVADIEKLSSDKVALLKKSLSLAQELKDEAAAGEAFAKLEAAAPRFLREPKPEEFLSVAFDFRQVRDFNAARTWYRRAFESDLPSLEKLKALDGIRMSYKLEKKVDQYISGTKDYAEFAEAGFLEPGIALVKADRKSREGVAFISKYLETQMTLARAVWTEGAPKDATKILLRAEKRVRRYVPVDDSILIRARIEEEARRFQAAVDLLNKIDTNRIESRELRSKVLWYRAWNERKIGRLKEAAAALETLIPLEESSTQISRDRFWLGKTLKDLGQTVEANIQFQKLTEDDTLGWYGLLAYRELGLMMPSLAKPVANSIREPASQNPFREAALMPEENLTFEWLLAGGEADLARKFLDQVSRDRRASYSDAQSIDLLQAYARSGQFQTLFSRLYELPAAQRKRLLDSNPELLFPQPWPSLVAHASTRFKVQSELIYSIMRQESSFNPTARSPADAFGLMQLIPEMAKKASATSKIPFHEPEDLYQPEANIQLGTAFVRELHDYWSGSFIPTVASYNASEKAISGWIRTRYKGDPLTFIEDVPYEETRNYIKLVMRNFIFYKRINSGGAPIAFPEWCLANVHDVRS